MHNTKNIGFLTSFIIALSLSLSSCGARNNVIDTEVFLKNVPVEVINIDLDASYSEGGEVTKQTYDLYFYQKKVNFTDNYPDARFTRKEFEYKKEL